MLYFSCCSRNNGVIKEGSILRWMVCLGKTDISRNEKENKCRNRRKSTGFREMVDAWLLTHQLPQTEAIVLASMLGC